MAEPTHADVLGDEGAEGTQADVLVLEPLTPEAVEADDAVILQFVDELETALVAAAATVDGEADVAERQAA